MKTLLFVSTLLIFVYACKSQTPQLPKQLVGGACEGCEAIYEYGDRKLTPIDTLPKFEETSPQLKITGTVYQNDGKTPAENIILYIYQTNREGIYEKRGDEQGWAQRHGYIRGWIKTEKDGKYTFYTFRPASYPGRQEPEHIHLTVKEPGRNEYYVDEYLFEDDPLLTRTKRKNLEDRGGSGMINPQMKDGILTSERNITLGLNVPSYN